MPDPIKAYFREGISKLSGLAHGQQEQILEAVMESIRAGQDVGADRLSEKLNLSTQDASQILASATFLAVAVTPLKEPLENFAQAATAAGLLDGSASAEAQKFVARLADRRSEIQRSLDITSLAAEVMPSLDSFDISVDVRFRFEKGTPVLSVPIALLHIDTDAANQELWCQASRAQLADIVDRLKKVIADLDAAASWAARDVGK